eukprot:6137676-Lingulodinium_polyedra.AAC.1
MHCQNSPWPPRAASVVANQVVAFIRWPARARLSAKALPVFPPGRAPCAARRCSLGVPAFGAFGAMYLTPRG